MNKFEQGMGRVATRAREAPTANDRAARTVIVTGGAGFVGSYVCRALAQSGRTVVAYDVRDFADEGRFVLADHARDVRFEHGSIDDAARFFDVVRRNEPSEIIHMASIIDSAYLARNRSTGARVNIGGAFNVLEAALSFGVRRIVNFSSIGILPAVVYEPIDAAHPVLMPTGGPGTDFYGATKVAAEALCFAYWQALGVDFRTIRPSAVYGLGMTHWVGPIKALVEGAVRGERVDIALGGAHPRDYTHAEDIASLVLAVLAAPDGADRIFYGATGEPLTTTSEIAVLVREFVPGADVSIGEELAEAERPIVALRGRYSIANAEGQLSWTPRYRRVRDGVARYVDDYRAFLKARE